MKADDEVLVAALQGYHREKLSNNAKISTRLLADHGIEMRFAVLSFLPYFLLDADIQ